jgi:hypothetical protein
MPAGSTYTPIATTTLGSTTTDYTFTSIPSTYTDLVLVINGNTSVNNDIFIQVGNGSVDTGANYSYTFMYGDGSSAASARVTGSSNMATGGIYSSGAVGTVIAQFQNYSNTTTFKTMLSRSNSSSYVQARVNLWRSTSAINQIKLFGQSGMTFNSGSTFTLYGIASA